MTKLLSFSKEERYFLIRRLFSLTGIIPIGAFFLEHLYSNAIALSGSQAYNEMIEKLMAIPFLPMVEIALIALPLAFHAAIGISIVLSGKNNPVQYPYVNNWRYSLQRITGMIALIYIAYHVWETRIHAVMTNQHVSYERMQDILSSSGMFAFYLVGVLSVTYHLCNGIWGFLITWGVTVSPRSQRVSSIVCGLLFLTFSAVWLKILFNFAA